MKENLVTWNAEFDCWILEVRVTTLANISLSINGNTDYTPKFYIKDIMVGDTPYYISNTVYRCPYFVKKGTSITLDGVDPGGSYIVVAPCMYVNA